MSEREEIALLSQLTIELVEGYMQTVMLLHQQEALQPPLREQMLRRLTRIAEMLDASTSSDFPQQLPTALHATATLLRYQQDRDQPPE